MERVTESFLGSPRLFRFFLLQGLLHELFKHSCLRDQDLALPTPPGGREFSEGSAGRDSLGRVALPGIVDATALQADVAGHVIVGIGVGHVYRPSNVLVPSLSRLREPF